MGDTVVLEALVDPKYLTSKERKSDLLLHGGVEGLSPGAMLTFTPPHTHTQFQCFPFIHPFLTEWLKCARPVLGIVDNKS